jgi:WD40 repeat protein
MSARLALHAIFPAVLIGLALGASPALAEPTRPPAGHYALLVGVSRYGHNSLRPLQYSVRDVEGLAAVLRSRGYANENVWLMTHTAAADDPRWFPSRTNVLANLDLLMRDRSSADTILVAFAGHGVQFRDDPETYFCPVDGDLHRKETLLPLSEVYARLKRSQAGVKVVLVDACRNDPAADTSRSAQEIHLQSTRVQPKEPPGGLAVLYSCAAGQEAFEDDDLKHGVFFHYVIKGLEGDAAGPDGQVTLDSLYGYVARRVDDYARKAKEHSQRPSLMGELSGQVPLVSARRTVARAAELRRLEGHTHVVSGVTFFPDGRRALSGSFDGTVRVWDLEAGKRLALLRAADAGWVWGVAVGPAGRLALAGCSDGTVRVWDVAAGKEQRRLAGHAGAVCAVAFGPDGRLALSGGEDGGVRLWDVETGRGLKQFTGHTGAVNAVAFSGEGRFVVSAGADRTVRVWDLVTGNEVRTLKGHTDAVQSVAVSPDGTRAVSGGADGSARVWNTRTGEELACLRDGTDAVLSVAVTPDGRRLLTGSADRVVRLWDLGASQVQARLRGHDTAVQSVAFSPDGTRALSGSGGCSRDTTVRLWQLPE